MLYVSRYDVHVSGPKQPYLFSNAHLHLSLNDDAALLVGMDVATSTTMGLKLHAIRVLADRAAILSPALLLPYDQEHNPEGVKYENITVPSLIMWGEYDNMMPAAQTQRFANVLGTDDVQLTLVPRAGHFAGTDQPRYVSDTIVNFVRRVKGRAALADINLGNQGIWKGDEAHTIMCLRVLHGVNEG